MKKPTRKYARFLRKVKLITPMNGYSPYKVKIIENAILNGLRKKFRELELAKELQNY